MALPRVAKKAGGAYITFAQGRLVANQRVQVIVDE